MPISTFASSGLTLVKSISFRSLMIAGLLWAGIAASAAEQASSATARSMDAKDYGRIVLSFEHMPEVETSVAKGVIVITFNRPINLLPDRIPADLPNWIAAARMDPDKKGLRLALSRAARPNLIEAGNDLYIDLLPEGLKGNPPPLPQDVIRDLSRKARIADELQKPANASNLLLVDTASSPKLSRMVFRGASPSALRVSRKDQLVELEFLGDYKLDIARLRSELPNGFKSIDMDKSENGLIIRIQIAMGAIPDARVEDGAAVVDAAFKSSGTIEPTRTAPAQIKGSNSSGETETERTVTLETAPSFGLSLLSGIDGPRILITSSKRPPLAAFSRGDAAYLAIQTDYEPDSAALQAAAKNLVELRTFRSGDLFVLRFKSKGPLFPDVQSSSEESATIILRDHPTRAASMIEIMPQLGDNGRAQLLGIMSETKIVQMIDDPVIGDHMIIVPTAVTGLGVRVPKTFPELSVLPSAQGLALVPVADDLVVSADNGLITIKRPSGLALSGLSETDASGRERTGLSVISRARWERDEQSDFASRRNTLMTMIANADEADRFRLRVMLARFLAANQLYREARAVYIGALPAADISAASPRDRLELAIFSALGGDVDFARKLLSDLSLSNQDEAVLWRSYLDAIDGHNVEAVAGYRRTAAIAALYPETLRRILRSQIAEAAIETDSTGLAIELVESLMEGQVDAIPDRVSYYRGRIFELTGKPEDARSVYERLSTSTDASTEIRARTAFLALDLKDGKIKYPDAVKAYQILVTLWRGDPLEGRILMALGRAATLAKDWKAAFTAAQKLNRIYPEVDGVRPFLEDMALRFDKLVSGEGPEKIDAFESVALFMDFREFMPVGKRGDELTSKFIDHLAELDLLPQATELLRYQISNRLSAEDKPLAAIRLAELYLRDRKPLEAVRAIADTRSGGIDDETRRARRFIEARARSELGQTKAAIDILEGIEDRETSVLRGDIYWHAKEYTFAGAGYEQALSESWREDAPLTEEDSVILLRAAIAHVLAADPMAIDRLRARYAKKLEKTPDAPAFRLLMSPPATRAALASAFADTVSNATMLDAFLANYRKRYVSKNGDTPAPTSPQG